MKKITQQLKITFYFFIFSLGLIITFIFIDMTFFSNQLEKTAMSNALSKIKEKEEKLSYYFTTPEIILKSTNESGYFKKYLKDSYLYNSEVNELFLTITKINKNIMQFRYIDEEGEEKIRIDRSSLDSNAKIVLSNFLQNKSNRYYFKESRLKEKNKVWFSDLDLNMEQGKVVKPFVPTLRAILPVFEKDKFRGILIINYFMNNILSDLVKTSLYDVILLNDKGEYLTHFDENKSWSMYEENNKRLLKKDFPKTYEDIETSSLLIRDHLVSKKLSFNTPKKLIYLIQFKKEYLEKNKEEKLKQYFIVSLIIIFLSLLMSYIFSKYFKKIFFLLKDSEKLNAILGFEVDEKAKQLQELNDSLEIRIKEEIEKNKEKDEKLFAQAKHAAMGEMLANIAHQWRQPLSLISTNASGLKLRYLYNQLDYKEIPEHMDKIIDKTQYLSNIIETFKNFLCEDKEYKKIVLQDSISTAIEILKATLKENFINLTNNINMNRPIELNSISSELTEVFINIVTNAKDVLIYRNIEDRNIIIDLDIKEDMVVVTIEDNAGGISEKNINRVFEPYFTTKHKSQGTGLGLHMSYRIIKESLLGNLYVKNTKNGAKFFIELPLK